MSDSSGVAAVANGDCAVVRFSTADYAPRERLEALHEVFGRNLQKVHVEPLAGEAFHTAVTLRRMPGLALYTALPFGSDLSSLPRAHRARRCRRDRWVHLQLRGPSPRPHAQHGARRSGHPDRGRARFLRRTCSEFHQSAARAGAPALAARCRSRRRIWPADSRQQPCAAASDRATSASSRRPEPSRRPSCDGRPWRTFTTSSHLPSERRGTRPRSPRAGGRARRGCARSRRTSQTGSTSPICRWRQSPRGIGSSRGGSSGCSKARARPLPSMSWRSVLSVRTGC